MTREEMLEMMDKLADAFDSLKDTAKDDTDFWTVWSTLYEGINE